MESVFRDWSTICLRNNSNQPGVAHYASQCSHKSLNQLEFCSPARLLPKNALQIWNQNPRNVTVCCPVHRTFLQVGYSDCGESDPLSFGSPELSPNLSCWSCGSKLADRKALSIGSRNQESIQVVEGPYRAALLGVSSHPSLFGKVTDRAFRRFVDDMLQLLARYPHPQLRPPNTIEPEITLLPRQRLLASIADLVSNAAPSSEVAQRRFHYLRSLKL
jgi:hypothetical protein